MTVTSTWTLQVGTVAVGGRVDLTSRMQSGTVEQYLEPASMGRGSFKFRLTNYDGIFTPGGGGTYTSYDWFSQGVFLKANIISTVSGTASADVFHGIISAFNFYDDGKESYVDITALDSWTIAGRTKQINSFLIGPPQAPSEAISSPGLYGFVNLFPTLGQADGSTNGVDEVSDWPLGGPSPFIDPVSPIYIVDNGVTPLTNITFADFLNQGVIPANISICYPTTIQTSVSGPYTFCSHSCTLITRGMSRSQQAAGQRVDYTFSNNGAAVDQIAFNSITRGFTIDKLVNQATIQYSTSADTTTGTYVDSTSVTKYGARAVSYTNMIGGYPYDVVGYSVPQQSNAIAREWVNRYGTVRFVPDTLSTSFKTAFKNVVNESVFFSYFYSLLMIKRGLWNKATITAKGNNGVTQTTKSIITGRRIIITPADTQLVLELVDHTDNHSFYLDRDLLDEDKVA
jgi:hypothetical protein